MRGCPETVSANGRRSKPPGGFRSGRAAGARRPQEGRRRREKLATAGFQTGRRRPGQGRERGGWTAGFLRKGPSRKSQSLRVTRGPRPRAHCVSQSRSPCSRPRAKSLPNQGVAVVLPRGLAPWPPQLSRFAQHRPPRDAFLKRSWRLRCSLHPEHSPCRYLRGLLPHLREVFVPRSLQDGLLQPPTCNALACVIYLRTSFASDIFLLCFF